MDLVAQLAKNRMLSSEDLRTILQTEDEELRNNLFRTAQQVALAHFQNKVYIRGLIELTNHCQKDCFYCGLRCSNKYIERYRLTKEEILGCCRRGKALGFRTFVLQGGEDHFFTDAVLCDIVYAIKTAHPDCAITLSVGERSYASYKHLFDSGADRYLLRHETADTLHYSHLHPASYSLKERMGCLYNLKTIGYQVGTGFMVGTPYEIPEYLVSDLLFTSKLNPAMVGIGPFIPHKDTPFRHQKHGGIEETLRLIAILRLMLPYALIPSTTALSTLCSDGRQYGILAGANVVMPNLSPLQVRDKYSIYDNKATSNTEAAENLALLDAKMQSIGYKLVVDRGDYNPTP